MIVAHLPNGCIAPKTHCVRGHEFTPENTKPKADGSKVCRECIRIRKREQMRRAGKKTREQLADLRRKHRQLGFQLWPTDPTGQSRIRTRQLGRKRHRRRSREFVIALKNAPCTDCGGRFHHAAMDFDHLPGFMKVAPVSELADQGKSKERILEEIAKCDLVCSNCHRVRTFNRINSNPG